MPHYQTIKANVQTVLAGQYLGGTVDAQRQPKSSKFKLSEAKSRKAGFKVQKGDVGKSMVFGLTERMGIPKSNIKACALPASVRLHFAIAIDKLRRPNSRGFAMQKGGPVA